MQLCNQCRNAEIQLVLNNINLFAAEADFAVNLGEQGAVFAHADIEAGVKFRAALANDNCTGLSKLAAIELYAAILRITVASVPGRTLSLLMCHDIFP